MPNTEYRIELRGDSAQITQVLRDASGQFQKFGEAARSGNLKLKEEGEKSAAAFRAIGSAAKAALPAVAAGLALVVVEATRFRRVLGEVGELVAGLVGAAAGGFAIAGVRSAIGEAAQFQTALAQVQKVAGLTSEELKGVGNDIRELTKEIPLTTSELAQIAKAGGQLGVAADKYREFISAVAKSAFAFEIPAQEAGNFFGQLIANFDLTIPQVKLLADAINTLADAEGIPNVIERDLLNVASRASSAARAFGLTGKELGSLSASLLATGQPAEIVATAINSIVQQLGAPEAQDPKFVETLERLGITASKLKQQIGVDAQGALLSFFERIKEFDEQGERDIVAGLFGRGGDANAIAGLVIKLDLYKKAIAAVADETVFAGSVDRAFAIQLALVESQVDLRAKAFARLKEAIGEPFLAATALAAKAITGVITAIGDFAKANPILTQIVTQIVTVAGALTVFRVGLALLRPVFVALASVAATVFAPLIAAFGAAAGAGLGLLARLSALRAVLGIALGGPIGIAVAAVIALSKAFSEVSDDTVKFKGVTGTVGEFAVATFQELSDGAVKAFRIYGDVLDEAGIHAKNFVNGEIADFVQLGKSIAIVAVAIKNAFVAAFSDIGAIASALGRDVQAAFAGDLGFSNLQAAIGAAGNGVRDEFKTLTADLERAAIEAGSVDYLGAAGDSIKRGAASLAKATGEALRVPFDELGNFAAERVKRNREQALPDSRGPTGEAGGEVFKPLPDPAEMARRAKAALEVAKATAGASTAIFEAELARSRAALEAANAANLLSIEAYYRDKLKLDLDAIDQEIASRRDALSLADSAERVRLEGELQALGIRRVALAEENAREQAEAERKFADERAELEVRLLDATEQGAAARIAEITRQYELLIVRLKAQSDEAGIELAGKLFRADIANAKLDEIQARVQRIIEDFRQVEDSAANRVITGDTPPGAAQTEVRDQAIAALEKLKATRAEIAGLAADSPLAQRALADLDQSIRSVGESAQTGLSKALGDLRRELASLEENFPRDAVFAFRDSLAGLFDDFIDGTAKAGRAVESFIKDLGKQILGLITQQLATRLTASLFGGLTSGIGSLFSPGVAHQGAVVGQSGGLHRQLSKLEFAGAPRLHSGGLPGLRANEVPIIAERGEEVLSRRDPRNVLNGGLRGAVSQAGNGGTVVLKLQIDESTLRMRLGDWLDGELARTAATQ